MRRRRTGFAPALLLVLVLTALAVAFTLERTMAPILLAFAEKQAEILGVDAITRAVHSRVAEQVDYDDLLVVERDATGQVAFMQVNTARLSGILTDVEATVLAALRALEGTRLEIPLGVILGSDLLAADGPTVAARVLTLGAPEVFFEQDFQTAGINQTRHTIYLVVRARLRVLVPLLADETSVSTRLPLVEAVIVGPVPDQFLHLDWLFPAAPPNASGAGPRLP